MKRCAHCGGRFGLIVYRWYGERFCRAKCRDAFLHRLEADRDRLKRWISFISQNAA
jgi:hypothetical protein